MFAAVFCWLILGLPKSSFASFGDRFEPYRACFQKCAYAECPNNDFRPGYVQPFWLSWTYWSCLDECKYKCMWESVEILENSNQMVPQFYGKWPFVRFFGIQEPASVLFSLLNFMLHFLMLRKFRREVRKDAPFYWLWQIFAIVCMHAWIWAAIFHTRDFPLTEFMDYACAFSLVLFTFYTMLMRVFYWTPRFFRTIITVGCLLFYYVYVNHLKTDGRINYGYNMNVNIVVGAHSAFGWFAWCVWNRRRQPYVWKCAVYVVSTVLFMLLELVDRPPLFWVMDCHALWHLATVASFYFLYCFVIDDCKYLRNENFREDLLLDKHD